MMTSAQRRTWKRKQKFKQRQKNLSLREALKALGSILSQVSRDTPSGRTLYAAHDIIAGKIAREK